jgi:DNA polymerase III delta prime subunit
MLKRGCVCLLKKQRHHHINHRYHVYPNIIICTERNRYVEVKPKRQITSIKQLEDIVHRAQSELFLKFSFEHLIKREQLIDQISKLLLEKVMDQEASKPHHEGSNRYGVYLTGPLGSGKTELLNQVASKLFEEGWAVVRLPSMALWTLPEFSSPSDACQYFIWFMRQQFKHGNRFHKTDPLPDWWDSVLDNWQKTDESVVVKQLFSHLEKYDKHRLLIISDDHHLLYKNYPLANRPGYIGNAYLTVYPYMELAFPGTRFKRGTMLLAGEQTCDSLKYSDVSNKQKYTHVFVNQFDTNEWNRLFEQNEKISKMLCLDQIDIQKEMVQLTNRLIGQLAIFCDQLIKKQNENVRLPKVLKNLFSKVSNQPISSYWIETNPELVRSMLQNFRVNSKRIYQEKFHNIVSSLLPNPKVNTTKVFWTTRNEFLRDRTRFYEQLFYYLVPLQNHDLLIMSIKRVETGNNRADSKVFRNSSLEKVLLEGGFVYIDQDGNYQPSNPMAREVIFSEMTNALYRLKFNYNSQRTQDLGYLDTPKEMYTRKKGAIIRELSRRILELNCDPSIYQEVDRMKQLYMECKASTSFKEAVTLTPIKKYNKEEYALLTPEEIEERDRNIAKLFLGDLDEEKGKTRDIDAIQQEKETLFQNMFDNTLPETIFQDAEDIPILINEPNPMVSIAVRTLDRSKRARINLLKPHKDDFAPTKSMTTPVTVYKLKDNETVTSYLQSILTSEDNNLDVRLIIPYSTRVKGDIDLIVATRKNQKDQKWNVIFFKVINLEEQNEPQKKIVRISARNQYDLAVGTNKQDVYESGHLVLITFEDKPPEDYEHATEISVVSQGINMENVWISYKEDYLRDDWDKIKLYFPELARRRRLLIEKHKVVGDDPNEEFIENVLQKMGHKKKFNADWDLEL